MDVFFSDDDRETYLKVLAEQAQIHGVEYLAWCLMTNHVHLIAIPADEESLAKGIGEAHKRYTRTINFREGWRGYLFQGRFFSCPIAPSRLVAAVRYVLRNPVRACLVGQAWEYPWSNARHLVDAVASDPLVREFGPLAEIEDWRATLAVEDDDHSLIRQHTRTGRPLGDEPFVGYVEQVLDRRLKKQKPGPPRRS